MKPSLTLLALLSTVLLARADIVIVQTIDGMAQTGTMTAEVGPDKVRMDVAPGMSSILDTTTGDATTIMTAQHSYMVISAATAKAMMGQALLAQTGTLSTNPNPPEPTGKKDKINGYDTDEYSYANGNLKASYWISPNYPNAAAIIAALSKVEKAGLASMMKGLIPDLSTLKGVPIKTEITINGQKMTTTLVSATETTVDPSQYQVPPGFTEIKMPAMPQMPPSQ